jgi:hypothetical protein
MPAETKDFIDRNYVRVNRMWVLGRKLPTKAGETISFEIVIPAYYSLVAAKEGTTVTGTLDGQPIEGARWLDAGHHELTTTTPASETALLWARAAEQGYSPYHKIDIQDE